MNDAPEAHRLPLIKVKLIPRGEKPDKDMPVTAAETRTVEYVPDPHYLPILTVVPILPTQSAQITSQLLTNYPIGGRFMVANSGTANGAADWIVNNFKINSVSQLIQSSDVPGAVFSIGMPDEDGYRFVRSAPLLALDIVDVTVTYVGANERGCPFFGGLLCRPERSTAPRADDFVDEETTAK